MRRWGLISPASFCYAEIKKRKRRKSLLTTIMIGKALATVTENENGFCCDATKDALVEKIVEIMEDPALYQKVAEHGLPIPHDPNR